jgi:predicted alpha/beta-fold hydrolase
MSKAPNGNGGSNVSEEEKEEEARNSIFYSSHENEEAEGEGAEEEEEDEDAYRLRVYGTTDSEQQKEKNSVTTKSVARRMSRQISRELYRRRSSVVEQLPKTLQGWTVLVSAIGAAVLGYEIRLQKCLTKPPITFGQFPDDSVMAKIYQKMTATGDSILSRTIQPSLFVGTRGVLSSTAAYLRGGPKTEGEHLCFREVVTSTQDGAALAIDWEIPLQVGSRIVTPEDGKQRILKGPIHNPVVIILHGINNDASFGYIRSLKRTFADRGWNAAAMNFRGCGGIPLKTPHGYNGAYTGDLRYLILRISGRLGEDVPVFIVGNSLGANVMTKYLGEEGSSATLPPCVAGAVSLANPLVINSSLVSFPFNVFMGFGIKKYCLDNLSSFKQMKDPDFQHTLRNAFLSTTIANFDRSIARYVLHNETSYPFSSIHGYPSGEAYWTDASSYRYLRDISVPYLNVSSEDDFLVSRPSRNRIGFCLGNPNVMVVETRCGGHLGWQESPPETDSAFGSISWSDSAAADFFDSVIKSNMDKFGTRLGKHQNLGQDADEVNSHVRALLQGGSASSSLRSKL